MGLWNRISQQVKKAIPIIKTILPAVIPGLAAVPILSKIATSPPKNLIQAILPAKVPDKILNAVVDKLPIPKQTVTAQPIRGPVYGPPAPKKNIPIKDALIGAGGAALISGAVISTAKNINVDASILPAASRASKLIPTGGKMIPAIPAALAGIGGLKGALTVGAGLYGAEQLAEMAGVRGGAGFIGGGGSVGSVPVVRSWSANGTPFQLLQDGRIAVTKKNGIVKIYRPYKPMVFGKKTDAKKFIRLAKKYKKTYAELHKIFRSKTTRK